MGTEPRTIQDRCERFVKLFAETENAIKRALPRDERKGDFQDLAFRYSQARPGLKELSDSRMLKSVAELLKRTRDLLAHTGWTDPAVIPSEEVVQTLARLHSVVTNPETARERFLEGKEAVISVAPDWDLARVMMIVKEKDFSQFPVVAEGQFAGILTEQSMARFIASQVAAGRNSVMLDQIKVSAIHLNEGSRDSYRFVPCTSPVDSVEHLFHTIIELEVVFITESGQSADPILGIATTWDIARLRGGRLKPKRKGGMEGGHR